MSKKILVTGATSTISAQVVRDLLSKGKSVRALARNPDKVKDLKELGADIVIGDLDLPETLAPAFNGIDEAFILTPPSDRAPSQFSNALWAAKQAGVKKIVRLSAFGASHDAPTINGRHHALSDSELKSSGIAWTIVKPHFFMQNFMMAQESIKHNNTIYMALADGKMGVIDSRDIADFIVAVIGDENHYNSEYTITGPESLSMYQVANILSQAIGEDIKYQPVSIENALESMKSMGADNYTLNVLHDYFAAYSKDWGDVVTKDFESVTGVSPRALLKFSEDFSDLFKK